MSTRASGRVGFTPLHTSSHLRLISSHGMRRAEFQRSGAGRDTLNEALRHASAQPWFEAARCLEREVPPYDRVQALEWFPAWRAKMDFDTLPLLGRVGCPVLAQAGGRDPKNDGGSALEFSLAPDPAASSFLTLSAPGGTVPAGGSVPGAGARPAARPAPSSC